MRLTIQFTLLQQLMLLLEGRHQANASFAVAVLLLCTCVAKLATKGALVLLLEGMQQAMSAVQALATREQIAFRECITALFRRVLQNNSNWLAQYCKQRQRGKRNKLWQHGADGRLPVGNALLNFVACDASNEKEIVRVKTTKSPYSTNGPHSAITLLDLSLQRLDFADQTVDLLSLDG